MVKLFGLPRAIARSIMPHLRTAGYTQRGAFRLLKQEGYTYPEKEFRADWRVMSQTQQREKFFSEMPKHLSPLRATMVEKAKAEGSKYVYTYKVDLYDEKTGKTYPDQVYSIGQERVRSIQEAEDELVDRIQQYPDELQVTKSTLVGITRR